MNSYITEQEQEFAKFTNPEWSFIGFENEEDWTTERYPRVTQLRFGMMVDTGAEVNVT